jgi:predicted amidohydrolase
MEKPVTVAAVQLSSQDDLAQNLERVRAMVGEARARGADVVLLPENFAYFGDEEQKRVIAEDLDAAEGPIGRTLAELARAERVWIVGGGLPERSSDERRPFNTCAVYAPGGALAARYRKVHLFDVDLPDGTRYRESEATMAGGEAVISDVAGLSLGLSVCYDVRFPELYRALASKGADAVVVPAAFTLQTGKDHWMVLLRARAIESQVYVIAAAQWGKHPRGRQTFGKSCVIDPWGEVIAQASEGEGLALATLDPAYLARVRALVPSLRHRRLG